MSSSETGIEAARKASPCRQRLTWGRNRLRGRNVKVPVPRLHEVAAAADHAVEERCGRITKTTVELLTILATTLPFLARPSPNCSVPPLTVVFPVYVFRSGQDHRAAPGLIRPADFAVGEVLGQRRGNQERPVLNVERGYAIGGGVIGEHRRAVTGSVVDITELPDEVTRRSCSMPRIRRHIRLDVGPWWRSACHR